MSEPNSGGTPPVPPVPPLPPVPQYGEYAEPGSVPPVVQPQVQPYAQPYGAPGYPQHPGYNGAAVGVKPRRIWDLVLTIILLFVGVVGMFIGVGYGVAFQDPALLDKVFQQQGIGDFTGTVGSGPMIIIASHVILYLIALGASIVLLIRRKVAFWVPLVAGVIAAIIFWSVLTAILMSDPGFMSKFT